MDVPRVVPAVNARITRDHPNTAKLLSRWPAIRHLVFTAVEATTGCADDLREANRDALQGAPLIRDHTRHPASADGVHLAAAVTATR